MQQPHGATCSRCAWDLSALYVPMLTWTSTRVQTALWRQVLCHVTAVSTSVLVLRSGLVCNTVLLPGLHKQLSWHVDVANV